jgi:hypothetical protein
MAQTGSRDKMHHEGTKITKKTLDLDPAPLRVLRVFVVNLLILVPLVRC